MVVYWVAARGKETLFDFEHALAVVVSVGFELGVGRDVLEERALLSELQV